MAFIEICDTWMRRLLQKEISGRNYGLNDDTLGMVYGITTTGEFVELTGLSVEAISQAPAPAVVRQITHPSASPKPKAAGHLRLATIDGESV